MRPFMFVTILLVLCAAVSTQLIPEEDLEKVHYGSLDEPAIRNLFEEFIIKYSKEYSSQEEKEKRLKIFKENLKRCDHLNEADMGTAVYGVDKFSDLTDEEFSVMEIKNRKPRSVDADQTYDASSLENLIIPSNFDWRTKGAVSEIKAQGNCGSCWAFATVAVLEGLYYIKHHKMENFAEQQLVDCDALSVGCDGGTMPNAVRYLKAAGGLELEATYPYVGSEQRCVHNASKSVLKIKNLIPLPKNDEVTMAKHLFKHGPVGIALDDTAMKTYKGGVIHPKESECSKNPLDFNHEITLVGYGVQVVNRNGRKEEVPYWIAKNSWGENWGSKGYFYIYRGDNSCGVAVEPNSAELE